jgi:transcriptional regulator PpsR
VKWFRAPKGTLGSVDADAAARLISAAADLALVLDDQGVILDMTFDVDAPGDEFARNWVGKRWEDTVTTESLPKVAALLDAARKGETPRWRQINHTMPNQQQLPVNYCTLRVGDAGHIVAMGRDLKAVAGLQQRLVEVQQSLERDYWQLRQAEARYRLLFQTATEPVLVIEARSRRVIEANPAAVATIAKGRRDLINQQLIDLFPPPVRPIVTRQIDTLVAVGRTEDSEIELGDGSRHRLSSALLRKQSGDLLLVRLVAQSAPAPAAALTEQHDRLLRILETAPDGLVITDAQGAIVDSNPAFLNLVQVTHRAQLKGESLGRWLGRQSVDLDVLISSLRRNPSLQIFPTSLRGEQGGIARVEVSATAVGQGASQQFGFFIRNVDIRPTLEFDGELDQPRSMEQITQLVGQVPLRDLVRESTDLIERLCIEAALRLTGDNRASAAEMLGLSRQSLYVKLRRHGLMDGEGGAAL